MSREKPVIYIYPEEETNESAKLEINSTPNSILRVFMAYKPLDKKIDIEE